MTLEMKVMTMGTMRNLVMGATAMAGVGAIHVIHQTTRLGKG